MLHAAVTAADLDHCRGWPLEDASHFSSCGALIIVLFAADARNLPMRASPAQQSIPLARLLANTRARQRAWQVTSLRVRRECTRRALVPCAYYDRTCHEPRFRHVHPSFSSGNDGPLSGCTIAAGIQQQLDGTPEYRDPALGAVLSNVRIKPAPPGLPHHRAEWTCRPHRSP
jgi:hypothetical protein